MKTYSPKPEHIERRWYVIDAGEQVLGRVATEAAVVLRGKHKPIFAPHMDVGDNLIIINAAKVVLTGGKETKKVAWRHSGHPGGITGTLYEDLLEKRPAFVVEKAVRGMLPKNRLGRAMIKKLHVVPGPEHNHQAQKPQEWTMGMRPVWEGLPTPPASVATEKKVAPKGEAAEPAAAAKRSAAAPKEPKEPKEPTATTTASPKAAATSAGTRTTARKTAAKKSTTAKSTTAKSTTAKTSAKKPTTTKKPTARKSTTAKKRTAAKTTAKKKET
jgi:large subunit ribosomal protein L13